MRFLNFDDTAKNLRVYLHKELKMPDQINWIGKATFPKLQRFNSIRHLLDNDATKKLNCHFSFSFSPKILQFGFSRPESK